MKKNNYGVKHSELMSILKNGEKDDKKLKKLQENCSHAWKNYEKVNDKQVALIKKNKFVECEKLFKSVHKALIKVYEKEIVYEKYLLNVVDVKKLYAIAKKVEEKRKNKK